MKNTNRARPFGLEFLEPLPEMAQQDINGGRRHHHHHGGSGGTGTGTGSGTGGTSGGTGGGLHTMAVSMPKTPGGQMDAF